MAYLLTFVLRLCGSPQLQALRTKQFGKRSDSGFGVTHDDPDSNARFMYVSHTHNKSMP